MLLFVKKEYTALLRRNMERRNTIQKEYVLDAVNELKRHVSADDVYVYLEKKYPSISRGTVYRNLNILSEEGKIQKIKTSDGADIFDFTLSKHYHVKCIVCKKVSDVDMKVLPDMISMINDKQGFDFLQCNIFFEGICPECKNKNA